MSHCHALREPIAISCNCSIVVLMSELPVIRIVITAFNSGAYLGECLQAVAAQTYRHFEVIIVDNGGVLTEDGYHDINLPDERFIQDRNPENTGFSGGFERGTEGATTKWLMSLNPDAILDGSCLETLLDAAKTHGDPDMLSPRLFADCNHETLDGLGDSLSILGIAWRNAHLKSANDVNMPDVAEVFSPTGAAALYLRESYEASGGINPLFFCYLEDVDLALRMRAYGCRCLLVNDATGFHEGGHSTKVIAGFAIQYSARNTPLLIVTSSPILLLFPLLVLHVAGQAWLQWRNRGSDVARFRAKGYRAALPQLFPAFLGRLNRKPYPLGASWRILRRLDWTLSNLRTQNLKYWPISKS